MNKQLKMGIKTESEHKKTVDYILKNCAKGSCTYESIYKKIAQDHIKESPTYYTKLKKAKL